MTGSLNDEQLRKLYERLIYLRNLEEKKEQVLSSIEEQGKLTEELKQQILAAETLVSVEDLYRPYRPKRRTRATIAKEKGLEPLAAVIMLQKSMNHWKRSQKRIFLRRRVLYQRQRLLQGREISLPSPSQITQITGAGSERLR